MTTSCDEIPVLYEASVQGTLTYELWVAKELCVEQQADTSMLSDAPVTVKIKNSGPQPAQLVVAAPGSVFVASIWDADRPEAPLEMSEGPPPQDIQTATVNIAPGATWETAPINGALNLLATDFLEGSYISDGSPLPPALKLRRAIGLEVRFTANVNTGAGFVATEQRLKGAVTVALFPLAP